MSLTIYNICVTSSLGEKKIIKLNREKKELEILFTHNDLNYDKLVL